MGLVVLAGLVGVWVVLRVVVVKMAFDAADDILVKGVFVLEVVFVVDFVVTLVCIPLAVVCRG